MEGQSLTLTCEVNKPNVQSKWLKNGEEIPASDRIEMTVDDVRHTLTIPKSELDDESVYKCVIKDRKTSARVTVKGGWPNVIHLVIFVNEHHSHMNPGSWMLILIALVIWDPNLSGNRNLCGRQNHMAYHLMRTYLCINQGLSKRRASFLDP